ncbi:hypothetical protein QJ857_gp1217 [Tupanvirus soda lake]|uniref:Uncharacterized protein n=2 Tax=Tupanvirus TaxID=2094720 RepID=A0A6N1NT80_9VIRU|nr:hypothetical protein QJ857_gp1217 [Tupanvirus soda lake]QKU34838.1 hypothetical protein [Tupanvirus soda lake]
MPKKYSFLYDVPDSLLEEDYHHKENIISAAAKIFKKLKEYDEVVCCAQMQSGKTEVMKRLIYVINKYNDNIKDMEINIDKHNIYLIICASSLNLKNQLKSKLPEIKHKIYHLNDVHHFIKNSFEYESVFTCMADSSLIIFDECHCDAEQEKLIYKFRNILDKFAKENKTMYHKVGFSATPYEQIIADYPKVIMEPGKDYYGVVEMFNSWKLSKTDSTKVPIIFQAKNLADPLECQNLFTEIEICDYYYIFRLPSKKSTEESVILNIEKEFKKRGSKFDSYVYDMSYRGNINELLDVKPIKPTIIYLKDKLRMGEYLNTVYVYMVHDDPNNTYTHTTAQSLLGRCCGYGKKSHQTIIYCDYEKALQHCEWIKGGYDIELIPHHAKYINKRTGETKLNCIY